MKRFSVFTGLFFLTCTVYAQDSEKNAQSSQALTPMQKEMLQQPGAHLCGNTVTNAPCDVLEKKQREWHAEEVAKKSYKWKVIAPGKLYALDPIEGKPAITLVAAQGQTLSEPLDVGFYITSSPACKAISDPINGPGTGDIGTVGVVEVDEKDYALDGYCDGGNMTMMPSVWMTRQLLLQAIERDAVLDVTFKASMPSFHLHYPTAGFDRVLKQLKAN